MRRQVLWLAAGLTSCAVGGFNIVDDFPEPAGGGTASGSAGVSAGGVNATGGVTGNGGSNVPSAGKAQGGQTTQGGSVANGGKAGTSQAGEPALPEGGAGGEGGVPSSGSSKPCDLDSTGMPPLLCDDFESQALNANKWDPPAGFGPEVMAGPHGMTRLVRLGPELASKYHDLSIDTAASQYTLSFWFNVKNEAANGLSLVTFGTATNPEISLIADVKDLHWVNSTMQRAPSASSGSSVPLNQWFCVSVYLTSVNMNFSYVSALDPTKVVTVVVDETPTPGVDDIWLNQSPDFRKIATLKFFGPNPALPGEVWIDDVRLVRDTSNVCGL